MAESVAQLKPGDRVVLTCEKARRPGSRPAKFEGMREGRALFLLNSVGIVDFHLFLFVGPDGTLTDEEGRTITWRRAEHREAHG